MERIRTEELPAGMMQAMYGVQAYLNNSGLEKSLVHLINMRVSQLNACGFCLDMHSKEAVNDGESMQRLVALPAWREAPFYTPVERAVLALAEFLTGLKAEADIAPVYAEMEKHFSRDQVALVGLAIIQINAWNRLVRLTGREAGSYELGTHG
ncbi:carboxymuconolactone decarboxylase [Pedobacter yulinensis]|uniref:Carboxymuconolactone decarboxylase n=1 Tax=Pedobacter yulinensis TaxID=2126353 RepID=A0A2T3HMB6_9SPHI|nr:carboxymuconolactone decarboxylase family protein [Pedobacter yulinensis]PST83577.1 carboxymuconolactone decarboxylase [Pedobacter yulinensis]